jgi:hypothetical protein
MDYTHAAYRTRQPEVAKSPRFRIKFETGNHHACARALLEMRAIAAQASIQQPVERRLL